MLLLTRSAPDADTENTGSSGSDVDTDLTGACGDEPKPLCEWAFDVSDGNETIAGIVDWAIGRPLTIVIILLVAGIARRLSRRYVTRALIRVIAGPKSTRQTLGEIGLDTPDFLFGGGEEEDEATRARKMARAQSVASVVTATISIVIWTIAVVLVLGELGIALGPFIAGAGIAGVALGFGAQSLVKDCISGLFMLMEDQYGIGDVVDLGEATGTVEEIALRTTTVRSLDGTVWHVPNGEITRVGNMSQLWSMALVDVDVAYDSDLDGVRDLLEGTARELCESETWREIVIDEPQVLGVERLGADGITMRLIVKTAAGTQWGLQRELRATLKAALDGAGVEIPFPQRTVWMRTDEA